MSINTHYFFQKERGALIAPPIQPSIEGFLDDPRLGPLIVFAEFFQTSKKVLGDGDVDALTWDSGRTA